MLKNRISAIALLATMFLAAIYLLPNWNVRTVLRVRTSESVSDLVLSPNEKTIYISSADDCIESLETGSWSKIRTVLAKGDENAVSSFSLSANGEMLAISYRLDSDIHLWSTEENRFIGSWSNISGSVADFSFSQDGTLLVTSDGNYAISIWDIRTHKLLDVLPDPEPISAVRFSPSGLSFASGTSRGTVEIWDVGERKRTYIGRHPTLMCKDPGYMEPRELNGFVHKLDFSEDGKLLASVSPNYSIVVWNIAMRKAARTIITKGYRPMSVAFLGNSGWIACGCFDGKLRAFNLKTGRAKVLWRGGEPGQPDAGPGCEQGRPNSCSQLRTHGRGAGSREMA